jgi:hypothetical protein
VSGRAARPAVRGAGRRDGAHPVGPDGAPVRRSGTQAQARPRRRSRPRTRTRTQLLGTGRLLALVLAASLAAGLVWLLQGPWLRVSSMAWAGARYTSGDQIAAVLAPLRGSSLLTLDDTAVAAQLASLPAVRSARVDPTLPGGISVAIEEKAPALVWQTSAIRLLVAEDGVVFGDVSLSTPLPAALARLPLVDDRRASSLDFFIGDRIPDAERSIALRLAAINPVALGSAAKGLRVRLDDQCGYVISPSSGPAWSASIGLSGMDPNSAAIAAGIDARVAAVRTLFAAHSERGVRWVDARNPGKVYWRPNGPGGSDAC